MKGLVVFGFMVLAACSAHQIDQNSAAFQHVQHQNIQHAEVFPQTIPQIPVNTGSNIY